MGDQVVNVAEFYHESKNNSVTSLQLPDNTSGVKWDYGF